MIKLVELLGETKKLRWYHAKIGTIPTPGVWLKDEPVVGKSIEFRDYDKKEWETGVIDKIDSETGFLFISRF